MKKRIEEITSMFKIEGLKYQLLNDDINDGFQKSFWFDGPVLRGNYNGVDFEIVAKEEPKGVSLFHISDDGVISDDPLEVLEKENYTFEKFKQVFKNIGLPIEDETIDAIENDAYGINNIVGSLEYEEGYQVNINNISYTSEFYNLEECLMETLEVIDGGITLDFECIECENTFSSEDLIQYFDSTGFGEFDIFADTKSIRCIGCDSSKKLITSIEGL